GGIERMAFTVPLNGEQEVDTGTGELLAGDLDGSGTAEVIADLDEEQICFELSVSGIELPAVGAHIHEAPAGENGPVVVPLTPPGATGRSSGCVEDVARSLVRDIARRPQRYYVNVHTTEFPAGALRGQLREPPMLPDTVTVQILGLNETHGQLVPLAVERGGPLAGGAAALAAYLAQEEAEFSRTLILDTGDFMQGPPISSFFEGESTVEVFNALGVDAVATGNHEFDWGQDTLQTRIQQADFPFLATNILDAETGEAPEYLQPYEVFDLAGVQVGVIGVGNPQTPSVVIPDAVEGLEFQDVPATIDAINADVAELQSMGVETLVLLPHQGLEDESSGLLADIVQGVDEEIDLVLGGHIPLEIDTTINGLRVLQPLGNTRGYADAELQVDLETGDVVSLDAELERTLVDEIEPDDEIQAIVDGYQAQVDELLGEEVGVAATSILRSDDRQGESEMGNFITDAMRAFREEIDFAFTNSGGLRADIDEGPITREELFEVLPFGNTVVLLDLTGAQVIQVLEEGAFSGFGTVQVSGLQWTVDPDAPFGERVVEVSLPDGTPIDPDATYRVVTNNFMAAGGDEFTTLTQGTNVVDTEINLVEAVEEYLAENSPVDPPAEGRLTIVE
ncbi:MAG: 5'-nucleotidase C-terminal domain-containing protein, partial [Egibacteraceae bacterium]